MSNPVCVWCKTHLTDSESERATPFNGGTSCYECTVQALNFEWIAIQCQFKTADAARDFLKWFTRGDDAS